MPKKVVVKKSKKYNGAFDDDDLGEVGIVYTPDQMKKLLRMFKPKLLIDTHIIMWLNGIDNRLSIDDQKVLKECNLFVSVASYWEITIKSRIGKLKIDKSIDQFTYFPLIYLFVAVLRYRQHLWLFLYSFLTVLND
jgi:hypothetical protein